MLDTFEETSKNPDPVWEAMTAAHPVWFSEKSWKPLPNLVIGAPCSSESHLMQVSQGPAGLSKTCFIPLSSVCNLAVHLPWCEGEGSAVMSGASPKFWASSPQPRKVSWLKSRQVLSCSWAVSKSGPCVEHFEWKINKLSGQECLSHQEASTGRSIPSSRSGINIMFCIYSTWEDDKNV